MDASLLHLLSTVAGTVFANLVMLPLVRKHLLNLHKRVGVIERYLSIEPTTPAPGYGILDEVTSPGRRRR